MLNRYLSHTKKFNRIYVPPKVVNNDITGSLIGVLEPTKKTITATKKEIFSGTQIINTESIPNPNLTASLQNIETPSTTKFDTATKSSPTTYKLTNTKNISSDFENEILEFSLMKIEKQPNEINSQSKKFIIYNTIVEYGTSGVISENIEVYVSGLKMSPTIYSILQNGVNTEIVFKQDLFDFDILETQNIIIIGKFLDIGLELEEIDDIGLTDENGEYLIL
jgi:hypothetical protein